MSSGRFWLDSGGFGSFLAGFGWFRVVSGWIRVVSCFINYPMRPYLEDFSNVKPCRFNIRYKVIETTITGILSEV